LFATVAGVKRQLHRQVDASIVASGPHDFAVRKGAARLAPSLRPLHPTLNVRDDAYAPHAEAGRLESVMLRLPNGETKYFSRTG